MAAEAAAAAGGGVSGLGFLGGVSVGLQVLGTLQQGKAAKREAARQRAFDQFNRWNAERTAAAVVAASQRQALEEKRQAGLVASRALAVASASGAGVSDPTMVNLLAKNRGEGVYRANVALYEAAERSRQMRLAAAAGVSTYDPSGAYNLAALGKGLGGAMSLYAKYGGGGPGAEGMGDSALITGNLPDEP